MHGLIPGGLGRAGPECGGGCWSFACMCANEPFEYTLLQPGEGKLYSNLFVTGIRGHKSQ